MKNDRKISGLCKKVVVILRRLLREVLRNFLMYPKSLYVLIFPPIRTLAHVLYRFDPVHAEIFC